MSSEPTDAEPEAPADGLIKRAKRRRRAALRLGTLLLAAVPATALVLSAYETVRDRADMTQ